ncbi:MAG: efflux RND transporter permease subunit [Abyssibacter sp.]|uniref:efflux RND transporter permease subunit n=1 Tax=Abyssibacter sp. TaxID=2320200 RepID=UPI00321A46E3
MNTPPALPGTADGRGAFAAAAGLLLAVAVALWLWAAPEGGLRFDPSTDALIDPEDLQPELQSTEELMLLLSDDAPLTAATLAIVDDITKQLEAGAGQADIRSLTTIQIPVDLIDSVELVSIRDWLATPGIRTRIALDALLANPLVAGRLVSEDRRSAGLLIRLPSDLPDDSTRQIAGELVDLAAEAAGDTPLQMAATGTPLIAAAVTDSLRLQLQQSLPLLALAFVAVLMLAFRCVRLVLVAVSSVALAVVAALAALAGIGGTLNLVTTLVVPLVATLTVAYQMHLLSAAEQHASPQHAARAIALPLLVTALTTALGLLALAVHPTPAIRSFALASALGVLASALITRYWSPHALSALGACPRSQGLLDRWLDALAAALAGWSARHGRWVLRVAVILVAVGAMGALQLKTEANLVEDLPARHPVRTDFVNVTNALWSTHGFSLHIRSSTPGAALQPDVLRSLDELQRWLQTQPEIDGTYGLTNILRELNRLFSERGDTLPDNPILAKQLLIAAAPDDVYDYTNLQFSESRLHIGTAIQNTRQISALVERIERRLAVLPAGLDVQLTGTPITFSRTVSKLTGGQAVSFLAAFAAIFLILAVVFASPRAAAFAILPNLVPVALFFGLIGWLSLPLGPTTALVACIVLGIAVDDTLHYLVRFNERAREMADARDATRQTLRDVIRPITLTTVATCLGFLTLSISPFESQVLFGWLAASTLAIAWLCDLTVAPAVGLRADLVTLWDVLRVDLGKSPQDSIPLLDGMSARQARLFALLSNLRTIPAGTQFIREGDLAHDIYVIVEGRARVWVDRQGDAVTINTVARGTTLGETGYFASRRTASVTAETDLRVLDFDTEDLERLRRRHPRVAALVYRNLNSIQAERLARATRQIADHHCD